MSNTSDRPHYAPENRSPHLGKFIAIGVFVILLLASAASLYVVINRGSAGIVLKHAPASETEASGTDASKTEASKAATSQTAPSEPKPAQP